MARSERRSFLRRSVIHIVLAALLLVGGAAGISRYASSLTDARAAATEEAIPPVPRPIYIYAGACDGLADVAWPLNNLTSPDGTAAGSEDADRTEYSFTSNVPLTIDALLAGSYAINVHESADHPERTLACGNVGGVPDSVGTLVIGLRVQSDLDVTGIAVLSPSPSDMTRTLISVFITGAALGTQTGTISPESTAVVETPAPVDVTPPDGGEPTLVVVPTDDDPVVEPTEIEVEPTEDEIEPTEDDDDHGGGDDDGDDEDNSGKDDDEDNSGEG